MILQQLLYWISYKSTLSWRNVLCWLWTQESGMFVLFLNIILVYANIRLVNSFIDIICIFNFNFIASWKISTMLIFLILLRILLWRWTLLWKFWTVHLWIGGTIDIVRVNILTLYVFIARILIVFHHVRDGDWR